MYCLNQKICLFSSDNAKTPLLILERKNLRKKEFISPVLNEITTFKNGNRYAKKERILTIESCWTFKLERADNEAIRPTQGLPHCVIRLQSKMKKDLEKKRAL